MAKETDLLNDPLLTAKQLYKEQVQAFKDQYIPKQKNPVSDFIKNNNIPLDEWKDKFN
tara:strand:- start:4562 stop:4735 length:174 start_codon:yes stop_codon:yes gene_type:complete